MEKGGEICENVGKSEESVELDPQRVKSNTNGEDSDPQGLNQSANTNEEDPDAAGVLSTIYDFTVGMIWGDDGHNESQMAGISAVQEFGFAQDINAPHKKSQEDTIALVDNFGRIPKQAFFAVYDGHGGRGCSEYCENHLHLNLLATLGAKVTVEGAAENCVVNVREAMTSAYLKTDEQIGEARLGFNCGTTAVTCLVRPEEDQRYVYTSNVGDSRAVISHNGKAFRLSRDHKASDPEEARRIEAAGAFVLNKRVNGVLAVSRALGHSAEKAFLIGTPFTSKTMLDKDDEFLILACDGVWDVMGDQDAVDFVRDKLKEGMSASEASSALVSQSKARCSRDNLSVIVVRF